MFITGQPDLDDKVLHIALLLLGGCLWSFIKALIDWIGKKELKLVLRLLFRRKVSG